MTVVMDDPADSDEGQAADRVSKLRANPVPATMLCRFFLSVAWFTGGLTHSAAKFSAG